MFAGLGDWIINKANIRVEDMEKGVKFCTPILGPCSTPSDLNIYVGLISLWL